MTDASMGSHDPEPVAVPKNIALGLRVLIAWKGHDQQSFGKEMRRRSTRSWLSRVGLDRTLTGNLINRTKTVTMKYGYFEAVADTSGIPTGVFFCCTRAMAGLTKNRTDQMRQFALGLKALGTLIEICVEEKEQGKLLLDTVGKREILFQRFFDCWKKEGFDCTRPPLR